MQNFEMPSVLWLSTTVSFFQISNLPSSWNALSPDLKSSYRLQSYRFRSLQIHLPSGSVLPPHFINFDFCDFLPDRFHQVYFQNIMFILVFFFVFNVCRLLCVILNFFLSKLEWRRILIRLYYWRGVLVYVILCFSNCALRINYKKLLFWLLFNQLNRSLKRQRESA
jgi:hypothetical protein